MFEDLTFDNVMKEMLEGANESVSTVEGSFYWSACAKMALELETLAPRLESLANNLKVDTMEEDILIASGIECGVPIEEAEAAMFIAQFNCPVVENARFSHAEQEYNYYVVEVVDPKQHTYKLECEEVGIQPSYYLGDIEPITIDDEPGGYEWGKLIEVFYSGKDQEDIEDYRFRRMEYFSAKAFAGNRKYYEQEIGALNGVGAVKINRRMEGEDTLIAVIASETFTAPDAVILAELQETIDPLESTGQGIGISPIEHQVRVIAADEIMINLETSLTLDDGLEIENVSGQIEQTFKEYLADVAKRWEDISRLTIVISQIEARILQIEGILDIYDTTLNGLTQNLVLGEFELPKKGSITIV